MKKSFSLLAAAVMLTGFSLGAAPKFATTIDFLDYVFYDTSDGNAEYYPLEVYEQRLRELAEGGFSKIYLRVNVCGLTLYPTRVSAMYGEDGLLHWDGGVKLAERLANTLKRYDVCAETIRLGKKYGMEVWAWDSLWDDSAYPFDRDKCPPEYLEVFDRNQGMPLLDPWFRRNPSGFAMVNPRFTSPQKEIERRTREARRLPVGRIEMINAPGDDSARPVRVGADEVVVMVSRDNITYTPYKGKYRVTSGKNSAGANYLAIDGLKISEPYVKIAHRTNYQDQNFSLVLRDARNQCAVYNTDGERISAVWAGRFNTTDLAAGGFNFNNFEPFAWDYEGYQAAFVTGDVDGNRYFTGVPEYLVPAARDHKLARFAELARYPFDGFMWNIRSHSFGFDPDRYGFNPEVRDAFLKRHGVDIWKDDFDHDALYALRAEGIADFFRLCKERAGGRPIWLSGLPADPGSYSKNDVPPMVRQFTRLPWLYKRYFADGSIDGVVMLGIDFSDYFTDEITGGKPVKLGVFREMGFPPEGYDYVADMKALKQNQRLDEAELYESMVFSFAPEMFKELK